MWIMSTLKRCCGYKGYWACADEYPDHILPVDKFGVDKGSKDGLHHWCRKCSTYSANIRNELKPHHPVTGQWKHNWKNKYARFLGGKPGTYGWQSLLDKAEVKWNEEIKGHLLDTAPAKEYLDWIDSEKESTIRLVTSSVKSRDKTQYEKLKELYNYTCQVESCHETEVEFAHILKHSLPNSIDNPTNGWCVCRNHHKAYDSNRMIVEVNGDFIRYDVHGNIIEHGRIIYNALHKVDPTFITLAREYHDRKKQKVG